MYWSELSKDEKDYFRSLITDYWRETKDLSIPDDPPEVTKDDVEKYWKDASAYFNTDDNLEFKEVI